jgi:membrane fusion protein, multidrug efflux system
VKVSVGTARQTVLAVGTFRSNEAVMIRPELASRIKEFNFNEGQKVTKGQVLVRLDAALDEAQLAQAEAALALSRANFERATSLVARQAGTEKAVDEARAALRRDEAALQLAKARVDKYTLVAPFDGVVGLRRV